MVQLIEPGDMEKTDDVSKFKDQYAELGTLRVEMWRDIVHGDQPLGSYNAKNNEAVPEKALKGRPLDVAARSVSLVSQRYRLIEQVSSPSMCIRSQRRVLHLGLTSTHLQHLSSNIVLDVSNGFPKWHFL